MMDVADLRGVQEVVVFVCLPSGVGGATQHLIPRARSQQSDRAGCFFWSAPWAALAPGAVEQSKASQVPPTHGFELISKILYPSGKRSSPAATMSLPCMLPHNIGVVLPVCGCCLQGVRLPPTCLTISIAGLGRQGASEMKNLANVNTTSYQFRRSPRMLDLPTSLLSKITSQVHLPRPLQEDASWPRTSGVSKHMHPTKRKPGFHVVYHPKVDLNPGVSLCGKSTRPGFKFSLG